MFLQLIFALVFFHFLGDEVGSLSTDISSSTGEALGAPEPAETQSLQRVLGRPPGSPLNGTCLENLPREASSGHQKKVSESPQLTLLDVEEKWLISKPLLTLLLRVAKGEPNDPVDKAHFSHLYQGSCFYGQDPDFMNFGEGRNIDRLVKREL